jgi:hypothetical protein
VDSNGETLTEPLTWTGLLIEASGDGESNTIRRGGIVAVAVGWTGAGGGGTGNPVGTSGAGGASVAGMVAGIAWVGAGVTAAAGVSPMVIVPVAGLQPSTSTNKANTLLNFAIVFIPDLLWLNQYI